MAIMVNSVYFNTSAITFAAVRFRISPKVFDISIKQGRQYSPNRLNAVMRYSI